MAKILGLHRPSISEIEAGRRGVSAEELSALSKTYGVGVSWLVEAEEPDVVRDRLELAARELGKLKPDDLDRVIQLLTSLRSDRGAEG